MAVDRGERRVTGERASIPAIVGGAPETAGVRSPSPISSRGDGLRSRKNPRLLHAQRMSP